MPEQQSQWWNTNDSTLEKSLHFIVNVKRKSRIHGRNPDSLWGAFLVVIIPSRQENAKN